MPEFILMYEFSWTGTKEKWVLRHGLKGIKALGEIY